MRDEYASEGEEYFIGTDKEYGVPPGEYSLESKPASSANTGEHSRRKRFLMSLCSAAAIVTIAVTAIPTIRELPFAKSTETLVMTDYQFRTQGTEDDPGLYLDGVRISSTYTKHRRHIDVLRGDASYESDIYPSVNADLMKDSIVLSEIIELRTEDYVRYNDRWMIEFSAPGFQFQPNFYGNSMATEAIAYYQGKCVALVSIQRDNGKYVTEKTEASLQDAYYVRVRGWPDANSVTEEGTEEGAELLRSAIRIRPVDITQTLIIGDSLKVTIDENILFAHGIMGPDSYALVSSYGTFQLVGFSFGDMEEQNQSIYKYNEHCLDVLLPIYTQPGDIELTEDIPLYERIYRDTELASGETSYITINSIRWRIFSHNKYLDCFCEEEPNILFRVEYSGTTTKEAAYENLMNRLAQIEKYK